MKQIVFRTIAYSALLGLLVIGTGCGKKSVVPPVPNSSGGGGSMSSGNDINYPPAEYSEDAIEGTLDDGGTLADQEGGGMGMAADGATDQASREYMLTHGRSSENLLPIYYDFDQYMVRGDMADRIVANGAFIEQNGVSVVIAGNCDERGTNEYNIALGEKRALGAKQYLIDLGIDESRLSTVSYGEERPLFLEQDEFSYEQNRRVDFSVE